MGATLVRYKTKVEAADEKIRTQSYSGRFLLAGTNRVAILPDIFTVNVLELVLASRPVAVTRTVYSPD